MILLDSNILMYAAGAAHPHKEPCVRLLERIAKGEIEAAVDAEVLQEILYRYRAIGRWTDGRQVYDLTRQVVSVVIPITADVLDAARDLLDRHAILTARDALHAAACRQAGAKAFCSYDRDLDAVKGLRRIEPHQVS